MKYILAIIACVAEFVACVLIAYLLGGGEQNTYIMYGCAGAGLSAMRLTWRKITKPKKKSINSKKVGGNKGSGAEI